MAEIKRMNAGMSAPVKPTQDKLHYNELSWQNFERLSRDLLEKEYPTLKNVRLYLSQGHRQEGIDIRGFNPVDSKYICVQCKHVQAFNAGDLKKAINVFRKGDFFEETNVFIISVRAEINKDFEETVRATETEFKQAGKIFEIWDGQQLDKLLKKYPQIVYDLFGINWVKAFNGEIALNSLIHRPKKREYESPKYYQPRILFWTSSDNKNGIQATSTDIFTNSFEQIPKLVLIKSEATIGKSIELRYIAHYYSIIEKELFFPVFISLKNYIDESIQDLTKKYVSDWEHISDKELLLLLDGLDEVKTEERENFIRRLGQFIEAHPDVNIVLSSRSNFVVENVQLSQFEVFYLKEFNDNDIEQYACRVLPNNGVERFLEIIKDETIKRWLRSPFCLHHFIEFYKKDPNDIPTTRAQLIERIFKLKIEEDFKKYGVQNFDKKEYHKLLERLAFTMNLLGRNSLKIDELDEIFTKQEYEKLRKLGVIEIVDEGISFEHNILQEYLSAKVLAIQSWDKLLEYITFRPDFQKVKPKWFNTIGMLLEVLPATDVLFERILLFISQNEPGIFESIEYKFFPLTLRLETFKNIISNSNRMYKGWEMYGNKLAQLGGINENPNVLEYLMDLLQNENSFLKREALYCLLSKNKELLWGFENELTAIFEELLKKDDESLNELVISVLNSLELNDKKITWILVSRARNTNDFDLIDAIASYLNMSNQIEEYLDVYLKAVKLYEEIVKNQGRRLLGFGYNIYEGLKKVENIVCIYKLIGFLKDNAKHFKEAGSFFRENSSNKDSFFLIFASKIALLYQQNASIYKEFFDLFLEFRQDHDEVISKNLVVFFSQTKTCKRTFWNIWDKYKNGVDIWGIYLNGILDNEVLEDCIVSYKNNKLTKTEVWDIITIAHWSDEKWSEELREKLNKIFNNEFIYPKQINWEKRKLDKEKTNIELLLQKDQFINYVLKVFDNNGKDYLTKADVLSYEKNVLDSDNNIIGRFLNSCFYDNNKGQKINKQDIKKWLNDNSNWTNYVIERFHKLLDSDTCLPQDAIRYIQNWCNENINNLNFKTAITENHDNSWSYSWLELRYADFFINLEINVPETILLDMLSYCVIRSSFMQSKKNIDKIALAEKIISIIGIENGKKQILENLTNPSQPLIVLDMQIECCKKKKFYEVLPLVKNVIETRHSNPGFYLESIFKNYNELGGSIIEMNFIFNVFDIKNEFHWTLLEEMVKVDVLKGRTGRLLLKSRDSENLFRASLLLIEAGFIEGLELYADWYKSNEKLIERDNYTKELKGVDLLPTNRPLNIIFDLLIFTLYKPISQMSRFNPINTLFDSLKLIALKSDEIFFNVFEKLNQIDMSEIDSNNVSTFKSRLFSLEKEYYLQKIDYTNIQEIRPILYSLN